MDYFDVSWIYIEKTKLEKNKIRKKTMILQDGDAKRKNAKGEDGEALAFDNPKAIAILRDPPPVPFEIVLLVSLIFRFNLILMLDGSKSLPWLLFIH